MQHNPSVLAMELELCLCCSTQKQKANAKGNGKFLTRAAVGALHAVKLRFPSGAINQAILSPVQIESTLRFQSPGACHQKPN